MFSSIFQKLKCNLQLHASISYKTRSSHPEVFLGKGVLKICSKFTGEHPCRSVISVKLLCNFTETTLRLCNFTETTLRHGCSPVNLLLIFCTHLNKNTPAWRAASVLVTLNTWRLLCFCVDFRPSKNYLFNVKNRKIKKV